MEFQKGMDLSFIPELEDAGVQVKDFDGTIMDPLDLVQKYGVNSVRLRIWNAPEHVRESGGYCSYAHTLAMAKRIRAHGMSFMLDFHYSDFWADPGQQRKPKDWENLSFKELKEAVFSYTRDTLTALKEEDVLPDIVQIGNEIRSGLLFPDGELPDYTKMVQLVNAGIRGARAAAGKDEMQVMIHLDQGGRYFYLKEWFDGSFAAGLEDFDLIGLSYYPFWHGTFTDLKETMTKLIWDYKKPIMVVETAHAWRKSVHGFIDEQQEKLRDFRRRLSDRSRCWIWLPMSLLQCRTKWVRASITGNRSVFRRTARAAGRKTWVCWMRREPSWMVFFLSYLHGMMPARKNRPRFTSRSQ